MKGGFTLLEVLVSLVILSLALVPILATLPDTHRALIAGERGGDEDAAAALLMNEALAALFEDLGTLSGQTRVVPGAMGAVTAQLEVRPYDVDGDGLTDPDIALLIVRAGAARLVTLRARP